MTLNKPHPPSPARIMRGALTGAGRGWKISLATAGYVVHECAEALVPILVGLTLDRAIVPHDLRQLLLWLGLLLLNFVVLSQSVRAAARLMVTIYGYAELEIRHSLLARVLHPHGVTARRSPGEVLSIATSDSYRVAGVSWSLVQQGASAAAILFSAGALLLISVPLGVGVLVASVLMLLIMQAAAKPIEARGAREQASASAASEMATDLVAGLRIIRGIRAQGEAARRYRVASAEAQVGAIAAHRGLQRYVSLSQLLSGVFLAALAFSAAALASTGALTLGEFVAVVGLGQFLQGSLAHIGTFAANWLHKRASAQRVADLLADAYAVPGADGDPAVTAGPVAGPPAGPSTGPTAAPPSQPPAALRWRLPDGQLLEAAPGALVGLRPTTTAQARALAATAAFRVPLAPGELLLDAVDATTLGPDAYRSRVFAPPHDATLFSASLRQNLLSPTADHAAAAAGAALTEVAAAGWDRQLGEAGRKLSGGQRQRVLLARAFAAGAGVVVLDEPTTALDPVTEARVAASLHELTATTILITRSPLLLAACDHVVALADEAPAAGEPAAHADAAAAVR